MAAAVNRRRKKKRESSGNSPWGSLFDKTAPQENSAPRSFFPQADDEDAGGQDDRTGLVRAIWQRFNFLSLLATFLFLAFTCFLYYALFRLWTPQEMTDIAGYRDQGSVTDIKAKLINADGAEISFSEEEINRYLAKNCRARQTGVFSIIAHAQGAAFRLHNGYAELVIDRIIGSNLHNTTSVYLTVTREEKHGVHSLNVSVKGGTPIMESVPSGGRIGLVRVPPRCTQMLQPALNSLLSCHPDIVRTILEHDYLPVFEEDKVTFVPHANATTNPS